MNPFTEQIQTHRFREQAHGLGEVGEGWGKGQIGSLG